MHYTRKLFLAWLYTDLCWWFDWWKMIPWLQIAAQTLTFAPYAEFFELNKRFSTQQTILLIWKDSDSKPCKLLIVFRCMNATWHCHFFPNTIISFKLQRLVALVSFYYDRDVMWFIGFCNLYFKLSYLSMILWRSRWTHQNYFSSHSSLNPNFLICF